MGDLRTHSVEKNFNNFLGKGFLGEFKCVFDGRVMLLEDLLVSMDHTMDGSRLCGHTCVLEHVEKEFGHNISTVSTSASSQGSQFSTGNHRSKQVREISRE